MISYNWTIDQMERLPQTGFVVTVHYRVSATEDGYVARTCGIVSYTEPPAGVFVPFDQLTEDIVVGWVVGSLNQAAVEGALAQQIAVQKAPVSVYGLPWHEASN